MSIEKISGGQKRNIYVKYKVSEQDLLSNS